MKTSNLTIENSKDELIRTLKVNDIVVVQGATGCGKSSKIPAFLAEAGYNVLITQPKTLLAISLAKRVSMKFANEPVGGLVGYHTGFYSKFSKDSKILFLTEETELLRIIYERETYENLVLIVDEVHEQTIAIELIIAIVRKLIKEGCTIKMILMSATVDNNIINILNAPIVRIKSNAYPVVSIEKKANELEATIIDKARRNMNILVFLPGKDEIKKLKHSLIKYFKNYDIHVDLLELHADLSLEEQQKIFAHKRKVILSTNIAESSITISDIDVVIDSGLEKILEVHNGVNTLCLRHTSQATCLQRKGRVGRCGPGYYILCSDVSFEKRPTYSVPNIYVSRMDKLLLSLISYNIDIHSLDFIHKPNEENLCDSISLLRQLGAIDEDCKITELGKKMNQIPLDVREAKMLIEAENYDVTNDMLTCCLLLQIGPICMERSNSIETINDFQSDLIYDLQVFNHLYYSDSISYSKLRNMPYINLQNMMKLLAYRKKIVSKLNIDETKRPLDITAIKKCLITGYMDRLFIYEKNVGYKDGIISNVRMPDKHSTLFKKNKRYLVGSPLDLRSITGELTYKYQKIVLPTAFSEEEILTYMSDSFSFSYSQQGETIYKDTFYKDFKIKSIELGTINELREREPQNFSLREEYFPKFRQHFKFLFYHDLKISASNI